MRHCFVLTAMLVGGCYVPPQDAGYGGSAPPGYPPAPDGYGYAQPGYPPPAGYPPGGYEASPYDPNYGYSGGAPTYLDNGVAVPLVLLGGSWGYYDSGRRWHRAPDQPPPQFHQPPPGIAGEPNRGPPPQFHQFQQPPRAAIPAAAPRPGPPPARPEPNQRGGRDCPPGQRC